MGRELSFKDSGEGYVLGIHRGIRWTRVLSHGVGN